VPFVLAPPFRKDEYDASFFKRLVAGVEGGIVMPQVLHPLAGAVHRQHVQPAQEAIKLWVLKSIAPGQRADGPVKKGGEDNAVQERVGVVGCQQQGSFGLQEAGFINYDPSAIDTDNQSCV